MRWALTVVALCVALVGVAAAEDWGVRRDPFDPGVVKRYKALLAKDPHDEAALRTLIVMYQRYRTVAALEAEYNALVASGEDWAALVVLARMPRSSRNDTVALWKRALLARPDDARGWLASGDAATALADAASARDAYRKAATLAIAPKQKTAALQKLIGAARSTGDHALVDGAYAELIVLAPKDGGLWLDRGAAQLAAGQAAAARDSFVTAETLLRTDPERRLTAAVNQGLALERLGQTDEAIAQYVRTLDKVPRGYFLAGEIVNRIIDAERKRKNIGAATARLEARWPERQRGFQEWDILGDLYKEGGDENRALAAYEQAVKKAPTEIVTQRKRIALLDKLRPADALAAHEAAARIAPGDADLQIALAKRYYTGELAKAIATLERLARRHPANINVRRTIGGLYDQWGELRRAIGEYEAIAKLEPHDPDHLITLGDAYWRANETDKGLAAWNRLDAMGTADAHFRHGEILAAHELWADAVKAYTKSIGRDGTNANAWYGRARAHDSLGQFSPAIDDARSAVALLGSATHADGLRNRHLLARVLGHASEAGNQEALRASLARWRFAFDRGDNAAGHMLVAHHARIGSDQGHAILVELSRRMPADDSLAIALSRSYASRKDFTRARIELEQVAQRSPKRAEEIGKLVAQLEDDRIRYERDARWDEEGASARSSLRATRPDLVGRANRFGVRLAIGTDVHNTRAAQVGLGMYRSRRLAPGTALLTRAEWTQRDDETEEVNAVAIGTAVARRLVDARKLELAVAGGLRAEVRYGSDAPMSSWSRFGLGADVALELVPRALPSTLGLRFHHSLTDDSRGSSLVFELGFEVR